MGSQASTSCCDASPATRFVSQQKRLTKSDAKWKDLDFAGKRVFRQKATKAEAQRRRSVSMRLARELSQEDLNANTPFEIGDHDYPLRSDLMAPYMGRLQELAQAWDARVPNMRVTASPFFDDTPEFNWKPCSAHLGHGCC